MNETEIYTETIPFVLSLNGWITGCLLLCFLSMTYVLSVTKNSLFQHINSFLYTRERNSIFNEQTMGDVHCKILLITQTCLLVSILSIYHFTNQQPCTFNERNIPHLLAAYFFIILTFYLLKWIIYKFINWIFFNKVKSKLWSESYLLILSILGFILFPVTLLGIYSHLSPSIISIINICIFIFSNLLLFYKCFSIFFNRLHGIFFLFVYFCTLEILPFFVLRRGVVFINELFI